MIDIDHLLEPILADTPPPKPFDVVQARAAAVRKHRRRRRLGAIVALAVVAVIGSGAAAVITRRPHHTVVAVVGPTGGGGLRLKVDPPSTLQLPAMDMLAAFGSIWISQPNQVARLDPTTGRAMATIPVPGTADARPLAVGAGSIWVDDTGTEVVTRIDPTSDSVVKSLRLPSSPLVIDGLAFADGKLWVARPQPMNESPGDIVAIDPATYTIVNQVTIPRTFDITAGDDHTLWFLQAGPSAHGTSLLRFDTRTLSATAVRSDTTSLLVASPNQVWVADSAGAVRIDPTTGRQLGPVIATPR